MVTVSLLPLWGYGRPLWNYKTLGAIMWIWHLLLTPLMAKVVCYHNTWGVSLASWSCDHCDWQWSCNREPILSAPDRYSVTGSCKWQHGHSAGGTQFNLLSTENCNTCMWQHRIRPTTIHVYGQSYYHYYWLSWCSCDREPVLSSLNCSSVAGSCQWPCNRSAGCHAIDHAPDRKQRFIYVVAPNKAHLCAAS